MKKNVLLSGALTLLAVLIVTFTNSGCHPTPTPMPGITSSMVIVSHVGEVTEEVRCVGETIKYRIYYQNNTTQHADIGITNKLVEALSEVTPYNGGTYDEGEHTVTWDVANVPVGGRGFVELAAVVGDAPVIRNQAVLNIVPEATTNTVETQVCGPPDLGWIPFERDAKPGRPPGAYMKDQTTMGVTVNFDVLGMFVHEVKVDDVTYHRLSIPGHATLTDVGKPELPIVGQIIEVPYDVSFEIEIVKSASIPLECYNVYPAQEPLRDQESGPSGFVIDQTAYQTDAFYPDELATIGVEDIGVIRGHRVVFLKVNPVQYNSVTKAIEGYSQIEVRLNYDHPAQVEPVDPRVMSPDFEALLERSALNYVDSDRFDKEDVPKEQEGVDYLILTHGDFYNANDANNPVVQFRNWKQQKGYRTRVVDIADIPQGQSASDIKAYLQSAYENWYPPPTYVLLVGDAEFIPTHYETQHPFNPYNNAEIGTDLYYTALDGTDYFPDLFIGRLPVDTPQQAEDVIDKIIAYEQNPPRNADFYTDVTLIALFEDDTDFPGDTAPEDGTEDRPWIENVEEIREYLDNSGYNPERIYATSSGFPGDPLSDDPEEYQNGDDLPDDLTVAGNPAAGIPGFGWNGGTADINNAIFNGTFLVTYRDHGGRDAWSDFLGFDLWDAAGLANGNLTPVVLSIACENGWFDNESDDDTALGALATGNNDECFGEHFIRNANGGAVTFIGATRASWTGWNDFLMFGMHQAIWPDFDPNPPLLGTYPDIPDIESSFLPRMGQIHTFGKVFMANAYGDSDTRKIQFEMYHLFGDPEMPIWTEQPAALKVDHPEGIGATGEQDFVVKVTDDATGDPLQNAVVSLTRDGPLLAVHQTNPGGVARFTLGAVGAGDLQITVTALNYRPYQSTVVVKAGGAHLNRLDPQDGTETQPVSVGGQNFSGDEKVDIYFGDQLLNTVDASAGSFGQSGVEDVDIQVPSPYELGPVNVLAHGQISDRYAVDVFYVRTANPIDLHTYSQWDSSTWDMTPGDDPIWDNPEIQLYDDGGNPVASNNLVVGHTYTIKAKVHNDTDFQAQNAEVTFKWANFGVGQPERVWEIADTDDVDVPAHGVGEAEIRWAPPSTGHLCMLVEIYHIEDINESNNRGQENLHVGPTSSQAVVPFLVYNPTDRPTAVYLELRQLNAPEREGRLWGTWVKHPDPQIIPPGEAVEAAVIIDPKWADVGQGEQAEFALTAFIDGNVVGGVNFIITSK